MPLTTRLLLLALCCVAGLLPVRAQSPQWQWATAAPFTVNAIATDAQGNAYVTGRFSGTITVGNSQFSCTNNLYDLIVAKYNPQGQVQWASVLQAQPRYPGLLNGIFASGDRIAVNPTTGEAYVAGSLNGLLPASVPGTNLPAEYISDKFVVLKLGAGGQIQWAVLGGGSTAPPRVQALALDPLGNTYLTGSGYGFRLSSGGLVATGSRQMFVLALNGAGGLRWSMGPFTPLNAAGFALGVDALGGLYVLGFYNGPLTIGGTTLARTSSGTVMAKLNAGTGAVLWARGDQGGASSLAVAPTGHSYVAGSFTGTYQLEAAAVTAAAGREGFLAAFDPGGAASWLRAVGPAETAVGVALADAGPVMQLKRSASVAAVLGLQPDGSPAWDAQASGVSVSPALAVVPGGPATRVVLGGSSGASATFGPYSVGNPDFLAAVSYAPAVPLVNGVGVYPIPAQDQLHLILPAQPGTSAQLFNAQGRAVWQRTGPGKAGTTELTVDVRNLARGFYTLRVMSRGQVVTVPVQFD